MLLGQAALPSALLIVASAVAAVAVAGWLPPVVQRSARQLSACAFLLALVTARVVGDGTPPAALVAVVALTAWAVAVTFGPRRAAIAISLGTVTLALPLLRSGAWAAALWTSALVLGVGLLPEWRARRIRERALQSGRRFTRVDAHLSRATPARPMPAATLRREALLSMEESEASHDLELLDVLLLDIRDLLSADEVIFWKWNPDRDLLSPCAWTEEPRPQYFRVREWGPLARWTAQERMVSFDGSVDAPMLAAAPVTSSDELHGVLTISSNIGLPLNREAAKQWLPRFATQVMSYLELFDVRTQHARSSRRNQALLDAMKKLQVHKTAEKLGEAVCEAALEVTSGRCALLIRWLPQDGYGLVQYASRELEMEPGTIISKDTLVGRACQEGEGRPLVLGDARPATMKEHAYMVSTRPRPIPSLVVMPVSHEHRVIGAIVVEGSEPDSITAEDSHGLGLLGAVARGSLEIVWEIEEVSRRARTDSLTNLSNRRDFDEQIKRVLAETDRFGGNSSLVLVDIDKFKAVNDRFGHEAGDAVLRHVARALADGVRTVDICARFGGDEIALLLPQTPLQGAAELGERLRRSIEERPVTHEGAVIHVTASFGIAGYPETVPHGDGLLNAADRALYLAKTNGRNQVRVMPLTGDMRSNYKKQV